MLACLLLMIFMFVSLLYMYGSDIQKYEKELNNMTKIINEYKDKETTMNIETIK